MARLKNKPGVSSKMPERLRPLFWDYCFRELNWEQDRDLITARVLAVGDWDTVKWLRRRLGDETLRAWIERRRGAGLSRRQLRFWEFRPTDGDRIHHGRATDCRRLRRDR